MNQALRTEGHQKAKGPHRDTEDRRDRASRKQGRDVEHRTVSAEGDDEVNVARQLLLVTWQGARRREL